MDREADIEAVCMAEGVGDWLGEVVVERERVSVGEEEGVWDGEQERDSEGLAVWEVRGEGVPLRVRVGEGVEETQAVGLSVTVGEMSWSVVEGWEEGEAMGDLLMLGDRLAVREPLLVGGKVGEEAKVWENERDTVGDAVEVGLREAERDSVSESVGVSVGEEERDTIVDAVMAGLGEAGRDALGDAMEVGEREAVKQMVGESVGEGEMSWSVVEGWEEGENTRDLLMLGD